MYFYNGGFFSFFTQGMEFVFFPEYGNGSGGEGWAAEWVRE